MDFLDQATRFLFFTGKGGVGKTSMSCATAVALADQGHRVLLVSTDPASNLREVLATDVGNHPTPVKDVSGLSAMDIDPLAAAEAYRERVVAEYRGVLPDAAIASIEEQLSGACTTEIAAFDEFAKLLGSETQVRGYDHIVFDTAPTGHTLRLLQLPAAWSGFLNHNQSGTSCLGPLSGLQQQRSTYEAALRTMRDGQLTTVLLVARPERSALAEAERSGRDLAELGVTRQRLIINGVANRFDVADPVARSFFEHGKSLLAELPAGLAGLQRTDVPLVSFEPIGISALRALGQSKWDHPGDSPGKHSACAVSEHQAWSSLDELVEQLASSKRGVIMTMGKGGVGKTSIASAVAVALARRGHRVHLSTTDPAAHLDTSLSQRVARLEVSRIDPEVEIERYRADVLESAGAQLDTAGRALLEEDLRSPCTEEIAVFRAFAATVDGGQSGFVVLDTAPTGHTLLLLDATRAYHREVSRTTGDLPDAVRRLLPRLQDREFTKILMVTLPESTPVHEAKQLERDLQRSGIDPYAWVINQSLTPLQLSDPILSERRRRESTYIQEAARGSVGRIALTPWTAPQGDSLAWFDHLSFHSSGNAGRK